MLMPAMSPTMTEGSITAWKKREGDSFAAGDVLLSIETDKASIDVEAQDDGIMAKILIGDNEQGVQVGQLIALLAEEGDDLSKIEVPAEEEQSKSAAPKEESNSSDSDKPANAPEQKHDSSPPATSPDAPTVAHALPHPKSDKPLLPAVLRMLVLNGIKDANEITGTGFKGTLTKGDVLAHLGKISSPTGTQKAEESHATTAAAAAAPTKKASPPLDGPSLRRLIANGLSTPPASQTIVHDIPQLPLSFEDVLNDYLPPSQRRSSIPVSSPTPTKSSSSYASFFSS